MPINCYGLRENKKGKTMVYKSHPMQNKEVSILITENDIFGDNILEMSDFFEGYLHQLSDIVQNNTIAHCVSNFPFYDLGVINEVIHTAEIVTTETIQLIPDFNNIPHDIKEKLNKGIYTIGESRQIDGNARAVIIDDTGKRIKDITLKEVRVTPDIIETSRSIINQLQMKQIYKKLDTIQQLQTYQQERDRDRDIKTPFLNARFFILKAQSKNGSNEERKQYLEKASEMLLSSENNVYTELSTLINQLVKQTSRLLFRNDRLIYKYISIITEDLQIITKLVGLHMQLLDYLGDIDGSKIELQRYRNVMLDFFTKRIKGSDYSAAELIHNSFPYNEKNRNCWYQLKVDVSHKLLESNTNDSKCLFTLSIEDVYHEE